MSKEQPLSIRVAERRRLTRKINEDGGCHDAVGRKEAHDFSRGYLTDKVQNLMREEENHEEPVPVWGIR